MFLLNVLQLCILQLQKFSTFRMFWEKLVSDLTEGEQ